VSWRIAVATLAALILGSSGYRASEALPLLDLDGHTLDPLAGAAARASVFLFTRTDCPISNRYAPELHRIRNAFAPRGIAFLLVYVDPSQGAESIRAHMKEYGYVWGALRDPRHALVARTSARVTPEAAVFLREGEGSRLVYHGRIDDRYLDFGKARASPSTHDLERKLDEIVSGGPETRAVGCFIADLS
jgi:hypothetical protein